MSRTILDLEDRSLAHLTRLPVSHSKVVRLNRLHAKFLTVYNNFVEIWIREEVVSAIIDVGLHSADC